MTLAYSQADFSHFIDRYQKYLRKTERKRLEKFKADFSHIKRGLDSIQFLSNELARLTSPGYNIFRLLNLHRKEVTTHSVILADLLNPNGTHCQRFLFLNSFLKICEKLISIPNHKPFEFNLKENEKETVIVEREKSTPFGNLDIVVSFPVSEKLLVIENKMVPKEQHRQLYRYYQWMESKRHYYQSRKLIYLTPKGNPSSTNEGVDYFPVSYDGHIACWLKEESRKVQSPVLKAILQQYHEIVKNL